MNFSKNKLFIFFSFAFIIGIFVNNIIINLKISFLILLFLVIFFFNYFLYYKKFFIYIIFICFGFLIGIFLSTYNITKIKENELLLKNYYNNQKINLNIEIIEIYKIKEFNNEYVGKLLEINGKKINSNINLILSSPSNFILNEGYILNIKEKLYKQENTTDFQYKNYLLSKNIYFKIYINNYDLFGKNNILLIKKYIILLKEKFINIINELYTKEEGIFLGGILIGAKENIPENLKKDFNNSGLTHLIAVSGFNITILIIFISYIIKFLPVYFRVIIITLSIIFFTLMVGDSAPVIRASIMGIVGYYILISGRKGNTLSIILFTLIIMLIFSPLSLNYDISLHLSFLAVLGIIYTEKFFQKIFYFLPNFLEIKTAFILTLSSLIFTLPIIILNFKQLSIIVPFANIAVVWAIPFAMLFGFLSIIVYSVSNILGYFLGYITRIFLKWSILMVHFFGNQNWAFIKFDIGIYKYYFEILYFFIIIFLIIWFRKKEA